LNGKHLNFEEFALYMKASWYQKTKFRKDYRSDYYKRNLLVIFGPITEIKVPKTRKLKLQFKVIKSAVIFHP